MEEVDIQTYIENEDGILPMFEVFYLESIKYATERANAAFERFDRGIIENDHGSIVVANIQEALSHVAELSRIFWPSRENGISGLRGKKLRLAFKLNEMSSIKNRGLRDALEHFDERLDTYLKEFPVGQLITEPVVGSVSKIAPPVRVFRMVDPEKSVFVLLDKKYEFGELRKLIKGIQEDAERMLKNGGILERGIY